MRYLKRNLKIKTLSLPYLFHIEKANSDTKTNPIRVFVLKNLIDKPKYLF